MIQTLLQSQAPEVYKMLDNHFFMIQTSLQPQSFRWQIQQNPWWMPNTQSSTEWGHSLSKAKLSRIECSLHTDVWPLHARLCMFALRFLQVQKFVLTLQKDPSDESINQGPPCVEVCKNIYTHQRSCCPCQNLMDYRNTKIIQHVPKSAKVEVGHNTERRRTTFSEISQKWSSRKWSYRRCGHRWGGCQLWSNELC